METFFCCYCWFISLKKKIKSRTCNFQVRILEMVFIEFRLGSILEDLPPALYENEEECETVSLSHNFPETFFP